MKKIEDLLKKQKVAAASAEFDTRMDSVFRKPPHGRPMIMRRHIAVWQAVAVSFLMGGLGYWMGSPQVTMAPASPPSEYVTMMYIIETQSNSVRNAFDVPPDIEPFFRPPAPPIPASVPVEKKFDVTDQISI